MPLNWHVNLPGPVAYSRPVRKNRRKSGPLASLVTWFIVKPLEWTVRGTAALVGLGTRKAVQAAQRQPETAVRGYFAPPASQPGWYDSAWGPLYWSGTNWYAQDGRPMF